MGIGAIFGAILTMYTAVATRAREIATLRALGFNTISVLVSVLGESLALGAIGGIIGGLAAYLAFNGYQTSTMNFQTFSQVAFAFRVTPQLLMTGIIYALIMGLVGGLFPAIRAATAADSVGAERAVDQELSTTKGTKNTKKSEEHEEFWGKPIHAARMVTQVNGFGSAGPVVEISPSKSSWPSFPFVRFVIFVLKDL